MKGKVLRKHSLHEKTATSVLLKLFIRSGTPFSNVTFPTFFFLCNFLIVDVQDRLIQTIQIKIYNKRLGQIQHMCPFKCRHSQHNAC